MATMEVIKWQAQFIDDQLGQAPHLSMTEWETWVNFNTPQDALEALDQQDNMPHPNNDATAKAKKHSGMSSKPMIEAADVTCLESVQDNGLAGETKRRITGRRNLPDLSYGER